MPGLGGARAGRGLAARMPAARRRSRCSESRSTLTRSHPGSLSGRPPAPARPPLHPEQTVCASRTEQTVCASWTDSDSDSVTAAAAGRGPGLRLGPAAESCLQVGPGPGPVFASVFESHASVRAINCLLSTMIHHDHVEVTVLVTRRRTAGPGVPPLPCHWHGLGLRVGLPRSRTRTVKSQSLGSPAGPGRGSGGPRKHYL